MSSPTKKRVLPVKLDDETITRIDTSAMANGVSRHAFMVAALAVGAAHLSAHPEALKAALPDVWTNKKPPQP